MESRVNYLSINEYVNKLAEDIGLPHNVETFYGKERELIAIVKGCPFLYDKSHKAFKDLANRDATWLAIANVFNADKDEIQSRWKSLRDHFNKHRGTDKGLIEELSFLQNYIRTRRSLKLFKSSAKGADGLESDSQQDESVSNEGSHLNAYDVSSTAFDDDYNAFRSDGTVISFIKMVENRPVLYARNHPGYTNENNKLAAWREISKEIGASVKSCRNYWKILRDRFGRERRHGSINTNRTFRFFEHLTFLHPHVKRRRRYPKDHSLSSQPERLEYYISNSDSCETKYKDDNTTKIELICDLPTANEVADDAQDSNYFLSSSDYEMTEEILPDPGDSLEHKETDCSSTNNDYFTEDDKFAQSIAAELKKMSSSKKKLKLKADIYRLLYESVDD